MIPFHLAFTHWLCLYKYSCIKHPCTLTNLKHACTVMGGKVLFRETKGNFYL